MLEQKSGDSTGLNWQSFDVPDVLANYVVITVDNNGFKEVQFFAQGWHFFSSILLQYLLNYDFYICLS